MPNSRGRTIWNDAASMSDTSPTRPTVAAHGGARLFAMLYLTGADAIISCWQDKARWLFWRPVTAIREADRDGNPATDADPTWLPLINTPPYPDHSSGLSCVGSSHVSTLRDFFGTDSAEFRITSMGSNTTRSFTTFTQAIDEIVNARVYAGIHFRAADVQGAQIGQEIARYRAEHYFRPQDDSFDWGRDSTDED
jgi:hypothetical protein